MGWTPANRYQITARRIQRETGVPVVAVHRNGIWRYVVGGVEVGYARKARQLARDARRTSEGSPESVI